MYIKQRVSSSFSASTKKSMKQFQFQVSLKKTVNIVKYLSYPNRKPRITFYLNAFKT